MIEMLSLFIICIVTFSLIICTYADIKYHRIFLPVVLVLPPLAASYWLIMWKPEMLSYAFLGFILAALPYFIMALCGKGGGGDVLLMGCIGFAIGAVNTIFLIIFTSIVYVLFILYRIVKAIINKKDSTDILKLRYPYAPFVLIGWIILLVSVILYF